LIGHFNTDELANYHAGIVSESKAARMTAHISSCPQCAGVQSGLATVSSLLASMPVPPMPETMTQRLHAAITSEATRRAASGETSPLGDAAADRSSVLVPGRPDLPVRARRPALRTWPRLWASPLLLRGLAAAGALVLLVGGGVLLANQRGPAPSGAAVQSPARPARNRPNTAIVGSVAATSLRYRHRGEYVVTSAVTSDADYSRADLPAGVRRDVANSTQFASSAPVSSTSPVPAPGHALSHTTVGQLESCLSTVATGGLVLLVEVAHYLGQPATIIVFRPVNDAFDVIVVGHACGPAGQDIITRLTVPKK
jgi:hypothetical protein